MRLVLCLAALAIVSMPALAAQPSDSGSDSSSGNSSSSNSSVSMDLDVVAKQLDIARQQIQPSLGATTYNFSPQALQDIPQGDNAPLNQVLLQAPGVAQDSFGQIHLRGEHANVQYRLNGVELPEGLSVFGQALESRFANSMTLITGALPAQYGFQTAGVVDIQTKTGTTNPGLAISMYGGQQSWAQPSFEYGGRSGPVDWFITADYLHNDIGIENPTTSFNPIHDTTNQFHGLAYVSAIIDPDTRISMILGGFEGQFQIPNNPGQPTLGFSVNGVGNFNSANLNENQHERTDFAIFSLQKHVADIDLQISAYTRYSSLSFSPDSLGDLLFNGIAQQATRSDAAYGVQADGSWRINDQHTLRFGFLVQQEIGNGKTFSQVLPVDSTGTPTTNVPEGIGNSFTKTGGLEGIYVQDEWHILPAVTLNAGLRFDAVQEFTQEDQVSPRINLVWKPTATTTLNAGYARYFVPPPFELVSPGTVLQFVGTTAAPEVTQNDPTKSERSNYFDVGVSQIVVPGLTVGVDGYYKISNNLIDEGQFGAPIILTAFNYAHGRQEGVQLTTSYDRGPWSIYGNIAWSRALGEDITSAQFNFGAAELAFIGDNFIHLDHDQTWDGSTGIAYTLNRTGDHPTRFSMDALLQSGLRASTATIPNGLALPTYGQVNLSVVQKLPTQTELRLDVLNVGDTVYQIRNGTGVGVGAPQYGIRRTILAGVTQRF
ncbi:MAG TPA: TonB-dependent receptor [Acetobacteraceae bacterium]|nr:TonB-dependent receptor [Acetobacteraceae bacterium]